MYKKEYSTLGITENHLRILSLFIGFEKRWYIRAVQKKLNISPRTAQLILEDLEKKAILFSKTKGKIKEYELNRKSPSCRNYMILVENYKQILFFGTHSLLQEASGKICKVCKGIVILFGSYAKGIEKKESDVDIFIIGKCNIDAIKEYMNLYSIPISPKIYSFQAFQKKKYADFLIKEVLEHHIILKGVEDYVSEVLSW